MEEQFRNDKVIIIKNFYAESHARLYLARLREAGIPSFLSNANTTTAFPFGNGGIALHVREKDVPDALEIIRELEAIDSGEKISEESFHDAGKADILFEKEVHQAESKSVNKLLLIVVLVALALFILMTFFNAAGYFEWIGYF